MYFIQFYFNYCCKVHEAVRCCQETLQQLSGNSISSSSLYASKQTLISKRNQQLTPVQWLEIMEGVQLQQVPFKRLEHLNEYERVVQSVSVEDLEALARALDLGNPERQCSCVGISTPELRTEEENAIVD